MGKYERGLPNELRGEYRTLSEPESRAQRLIHSSFYIFGGEESYGYSGADFVRDKDGNGAAIMFCEVAAYAKARGNSRSTALLDEIYRPPSATTGKRMARSLSKARKARPKSNDSWNRM